MLNEERAIVSEIAGTTRDTIEDEISIGGIGFRFIDTAGIRDTVDVVEGMGIKKTFEKIDQAQVVIYMFDAPSAFGISPKGGEFNKVLLEIEKIKNKYPQKPLIIVANKVDRLQEDEISKLNASLSARQIVILARQLKGQLYNYFQPKQGLELKNYKTGSLNL